ncbi:UDP-glucose dehydrogenase family protein [Thioflexithrix psekupsensis]|uniref:UDP-glucose 6-dehydrogenase n=1 Tax=Thioflexithrix psekupsensis TaxID=1570016 RepID=A0A251X4Q8_9GAMM|nr:UDP-glucose/GDP-mannose dehydrogenase family protein [Thioflexithrix psekupsensis]OUD12493.1 UDP-glucose 6-dehydrogenase [Thioflexithrix psekupsensis]
MRVSVFGAGYVGLVTAACFADVGNHVVCVDVDSEKITLLNQGIVPMHEPGMENLLVTNLNTGRLQFTTDPAVAVQHGEVLFIAVGTPPDEDGSADLQYVLQVAHVIGQLMTETKCVVNKSTVPVGTATAVKNTILRALNERGLDYPVDVVSNPEFLKEGAAIADFMRPDRIVLGTDSPEAIEVMRELYAPFNRNRDRLIVMSVASAELTKYAANAILATKISFMNEMANLADSVGADIEQVRLGIGSDPRIGFDFLYAGCGYGGSCFPKDVKALRHTFQAFGGEAKILQAVENVNQQQHHRLFDKIKKFYGEDLTGRCFALWGLAFKPNTDDMREAPSRTLLSLLWAAGARVQAYDPKAMSEARRIYGQRADFKLCDSPHAALDKADALIIMTEWKVFRSPDFSAIKNQLKQAVIFDGRNLYDPKRMKARGFRYFGIGRGESLV